MTTDIVQARYNEVEGVAGRLAGAGERVQEIARGVQARADVLRRGGWEGKGQAAFLAEMDALVLPSLHRLAAALAEARGVTQAMRQAIQLAEEEAARLFEANGAAAGNNAGAGESWEGQKLAFLGDDEEELSPLDAIQTVMDVAGFIPGIGDVIDLVNAGIYAVRGDWTIAALALLAVIPLIGSAAVLGRLGSKGPKVLRTLGRLLGLSDEAASVGRGVNNFASSEKLLSHFAKHGERLGVKSVDEYLAGARNLIKQEHGVEKFVRSNGDTLYYNKLTNEFGVVSPDGYLRTYFKPKQGAKYWDTQITKQ